MPKNDPLLVKIFYLHLVLAYVFCPVPALSSWTEAVLAAQSRFELQDLERVLFMQELCAREKQRGLIPRACYQLGELSSAEFTESCLRNLQHDLRSVSDKDLEFLPQTCRDALREELDKRIYARNSRFYAPRD